jgi:thioredoxin reductase (NADPH)
LPDDYDVAIAGGGIAALTAGLYSARLGRRTLVLTGGAPGGLLLSINEIEGVPGFPEGVPGYDLCPMVQEQAAESGAEFEMTELTGLEPDGDGWRLSAGSDEYSARAVILATGARLKELGVEGEQRLRGRGVSHCASCDAPLLRDKVVGVVGGGDSALQEALTLANDVSEVIVLHRGDALSAQATYRERALAHPKITVRFGAVVEEVLGEDKVGGVRVREDGEVSELELSGLFVYVGLQPNTELLAGQLALDEDGRLPVDGRLRTELPGVFAAGVLRRDAACQATGSAGDGALAAKAADRWLDEGGWADQIPAEAAAVAAGNGGTHG